MFLWMNVAPLASLITGDVKIYQCYVIKRSVLQIIFKISRSGWSEKLKSPQSYQIIGGQIKIFWLLFFCVILRYICRTWNFLWYQNYIYVIVILVFYILFCLVFYILFCLIKRFINVKMKRLIVFRSTKGFFKKIIKIMNYEHNIRQNISNIYLHFCL